MSPMRDWRILVVEDEPDNQLVVAGLLSYFNIAVDAVGTAEEALAFLQNVTYQCAIIDLMLPGMDGLSLVQTIRANDATAQLPCIAITAYHTSAVKQQAIESGFDAYFSKPLDDTTFVRELERLIR